MVKLPVTVGAKLVVRLDDMSATGVRPVEISRLLRHSNPEYHKKRAMGLWTGNIPQTLTLVDQGNGEISLPRGAWRLLGAFLKTKGVAPAPVNRTLSGTLVRPLSYRAPFELDVDQRSAVSAIVGGKQGVVVAPCGAGKTEVALAAIAEVGERALILVHTDRLLKRWLDVLPDRLGLPKRDIGVFSGNMKRVEGCPVVVGMMQSVKNRIQKDPSFMSNFGMLVVDEAHHAPCMTLTDIVDSSPARWRVGLTATPKRKDGMEFLLWDLFGWEVGRSRTGELTRSPRILCRITDADIDRHGRIVPVEVVVVPTEFEYREELHGPGMYGKMLDKMVSDEGRLDLIKRTLVRELNSGGTCLLLADRRELCLKLRDELERSGIRCGLMLGGDRKEADRAERGLQDGTLKVAVGTTIADEGLDIKRIDRGFGCTPAASNAGRFTQQIGRFKRRAPGKRDAKYFYFWDRRVPQLSGHLKKIRAAVKAPHRVTVLG